MEALVERAFQVVSSNPEWMEYVKNFNGPHGFAYTTHPILKDICLAVEEDYDIHSGNSLGLTLRACQSRLRAQT
jgi:hypothetical protein